METEDHDLEGLTKITSALWAESENGERALLDAVAGASLLGLNPSRKSEKVLQALLERAGRDGTLAIAFAASRPFYRMLPEERLVLAALHRARWSYARLARALGKDADAIQELAWAARLHLASAPGTPVYLPTPVGSKASPSCPDFDPRKPWTQRFLDEELSSGERLFFQSHLSGCEPCRNALGKARKLYYFVDGQVPEAAFSAGNALALKRELKPAYEVGFGESVERLLRRRDVLFAIGLIAGSLAWELVRAIV